jgi:hypothetical protein
MNNIIANAKNIVQVISNIVTGFFNITRQINSEMSHNSLNNISVSITFHRAINLFLLAPLSAVFVKLKEDVNEVISNGSRTLSVAAELTIERAKNAISTVLNEALEKMHYEIEMIVNDVITNQMVIAVGIFLLIILLLIFGYVFVHIHITLGCCAQRVKLIIKMILILVYPLLCIFYVLTLKSLVETAMEKKNLLCVIGVSILLAPSLYLIFSLTWWNNVNSTITHAYKRVIRWCTASKPKQPNDLMSPNDVNFTSVATI